MISQNATSSRHGRRRKIPFVFTEQGVAGLSGVLKNEKASKIHVIILRAFVSMRKLIASHHGLLQRMDGLERKHLETEQKIEKVFKALEQNIIPTQGVFFDGQLFDAYELISRIIRSAKKKIVLIDNYVDESTIVHLSKKKNGVLVSILSTSSGKQLQEI